MSLKEKVLLRKIKNREKKKLDLLKSREDYLRLIVLVEAKPELYDLRRKDYHNQETIAKAWQAISEEMNVSSYECKSKWHTLRSSYGRYLRNIKRKPGGRRHKWYLADAMSFLHPYLILKRKKKNLKAIKHLQEIATENEEEIAMKRENSRRNENADEFEAEDEVGEETAGPETDISTTNDREPELTLEISTNKRKNRNANELFDKPISSYFGSSTKKSAYEHPVLMFFKSLMPDVEKLSQTSQRRFKTDILHSLNFYLDNQESSASSPYPFSRPSSNNSDSGSNHSTSLNDDLHLRDVQCVMDLT